MTICGQRGDGPVMCRRLTRIQAFLIWHRWFGAIDAARADSPVIVGDMRVWSL